MTLNPTERDAVLAGLRLLQRVLGDPRTVMDDIRAIACDSGEPITVEAIDALCERLNR